MLLKQRLSINTEGKKKQLRNKSLDARKKSGLLKTEMEKVKILRGKWECSLNGDLKQLGREKKYELDPRKKTKPWGKRKTDLKLGISMFRRIVAVRAKRTRTVKQTEVTFWDDAIEEASFFSLFSRENGSGERREKVRKSRRRVTKLVHKLQRNRLRYLYANKKRYRRR